MKNPLSYFEKLLNQTQEKVKVEYMSNMSEFVPVESKDYDKGIIKYYSMIYDINTDSGIEVLHTFKFLEAFYNDIKKENFKSLELIKNDILEITKGGNSPQYYIKELEQRLDKLKVSAKNNFPDYPKLAEEIEKLKSNITGNQFVVLKSSKRPVGIQNYYEDSFSWSKGNTDEEKIDYIKRFYRLLTERKIIISTEEDFINAFTQRNIDKGISWQLKCRNSTHIRSIFYFINKLEEELFIDEIENKDFGRKIHYVFRNYEGNQISKSSIKASLSDFRKDIQTSSFSDRIDEMISQIKQPN